MRHFLDFEKPIAALEGKVEELRHMSSDGSINIADEIGKLQSRIERELKQTYDKLGPWEKVQVARHPDRPRVSTIINQLFDDFTPLSGDRNYAEDYAVIGGMARFRGQAVMVMGTEKGSSTEERIKRNFGMARPEGYRKAARLMELAGRFGLPVLSFVDTAGAYPGRGAEERGQAEAIATAIRACLRLPRLPETAGAFAWACLRLAGPAWACLRLPGRACRHAQARPGRPGGTGGVARSGAEWRGVARRTPVPPACRRGSATVSPSNSFHTGGS